MYEWETEINKTSINTRIHNLRQEIKRISTVTLRGNFKKEEDRKYWESKLRTLNGELSALEEMANS